MKDEHAVYPVFTFLRRRDLEAPDRIFAGLLSLNTFAERHLSHRHRVELGKIIDGLARDAREGRLQDIVIGWPAKRPPTNAADVTNDTEMKWWRQASLQRLCSSRSARRADVHTRQSQRLADISACYSETRKERTPMSGMIGADDVIAELRRSVEKGGSGGGGHNGDDGDGRGGGDGGGDHWSAFIRKQFRRSVLPYRGAVKKTKRIHQSLD